jgi:hypothetical protein
MKPFVMYAGFFLIRYFPFHQGLVNASLGKHSAAGQDFMKAVSAVSNATKVGGAGTMFIPESSTVKSIGDRLQAELGIAAAHDVKEKLENAGGGDGSTRRGGRKKAFGTVRPAWMRHEPNKRFPSLTGKVTAKNIGGQYEEGFHFEEPVKAGELFGILPCCQSRFTLLVFLSSKS